MHLLNLSRALYLVLHFASQIESYLLPYHLKNESDNIRLYYLPVILAFVKICFPLFFWYLCHESSLSNSNIFLIIWVVGSLF